MNLGQRRWWVAPVIGAMGVILLSASAHAVDCPATQAEIAAQQASLQEVVQERTRAVRAARGSARPAARRALAAAQADLATITACRPTAAAAPAQSTTREQRFGEIENESLCLRNAMSRPGTYTFDYVSRSERNLYQDGGWVDVGSGCRVKFKNATNEPVVLRSPRRFNLGAPLPQRLMADGRHEVIEIPLLADPTFAVMECRAYNYAITEGVALNCFMYGSNGSSGPWLRHVPNVPYPTAHRESVSDRRSAKPNEAVSGESAAPKDANRAGTAH